MSSIPRILTPKESFTIDYPEAVEFMNQQQGVFWPHYEVKVAKDKQDILVNMTESERHGTIEVLRLFTKYECVDSDTEVLTPLGWKKISDYSEGDEIAQWWPATKHIDFVKPSRMYSKQYTGKMIKIYDKKGQIEQLVTPNHRMPTRIQTHEDYGFTEAKDTIYNCNKFMPISGYGVGSKNELTFVERFLIAAQADGSIRTQVVDEGSRLGGIVVTFGFSKERKISRFKWIMDNLGWDVKENQYEQRTTTKKQMTTFRVVMPFDTVKNKADVKSLKSWVTLEDKSALWAKDFINEISQWDGSVTKEGAVDYRSRIKENAEVVQMVGVVGGFHGQVCVQVDNRSENFSDIYYTKMRSSTEKRCQYIIKEEEEYDGYVYCPTVPSGAFMVRKNGKVSITGNCIIGNEFWINWVMKKFPRPADIQPMASMFAAIELAVHGMFYKTLNEEIGVATDEFYNSYKEDDELLARINFLESALEGDDDLKALGSFTFGEGAILYTSFAFLKHFQSQGKNKLLNVVSGINFSARDEHLHSEAAAWLFRTLKKEGKDSGLYSEAYLKEVEEYIYAAAKEVFEHEKVIAAKIFAKGKMDGITEHQLHNFAMSRIDLCLKNLGYNPLFKVEYNPIGDWFYKGITGYQAQDFFNSQGNQYGRDWNALSFTWKKGE